MLKVSGSNLARAKRHNRAYIKELIYKYGPITRSKIARMLSLTPPTITTSVAEMIASGMVEETGPEKNSDETLLGRKPVDIDFIHTYAYFIGVEITPKQRFICLMDLRANIIAQKQLDSEETEYETVIDEVVSLVNNILEQSHLPLNKVFGLGVGMPGFVESGSGLVRRYPRFNWKNKPLAEDLRARISLPLLVDNNTRVRAIGEDLIGPKERPDSFAYFFVSRGIACPLMIRNSFFSGRTAGAGEVGHMVMDVNGYKCETCGNNGCLEAYASDTALLKNCRAIMKSGKQTHLSDLAPSPEKLTLKHILEAVTHGDSAVISLVNEAVQYLAIAVANIVNFVSPQLVIVDAYIMKSAENKKLFLSVFEKNIYGLTDPYTEIEFKEYDRFGGAKGAAAAAIRHFFIREGASQL